MELTLETPGTLAGKVELTTQTLWASQAGRQTCQPNTHHHADFYSRSLSAYEDQLLRKENKIKVVEI